MTNTQKGSIDLKAQKEAAKTASDYITDITNDGIMVHAEGEGPDDTQTPTGWHISNVLEFIRQGVSRFWIGLKNSGDTTPTVRIGKDSGESRMELDYNGMKLLDKNENVYFHVSDLRDEDGMATLTEVFKGDGSKQTFRVQLEVAEEVSATDSSHKSNTVTRSSKDYTFAIAPDDGATVTIVYKTTSPYAKAYTLGQRGNGTIGAYSVAEGYNLIASAWYSHAEGYNAIASDEGSHAEGENTKASGYCSHAEGKNTVASDWHSHAEGENTTANYQNSHAEGKDTVANGFDSHVQNLGTITSQRAQTALGTYNVEDTSNTTTHPSQNTDYGTYAAIIGNGTSDSARSNALAVRWNGLTDVAGRTAYPLFIYNGKPAESAAPITPCFIYDTSDNGLYYYSG